MEKLQQKLQKYIKYLISGSLILLMIIAVYLLLKVVASQPFLNLKARTISGHDIIFVTETIWGSHEELAFINKDGTGFGTGTYTEDPGHYGKLQALMYRYLPRYAPDLVMGVYKDDPTWSPTGEKVAFISGIYYWEFDIVAHKGDIFVMNSDGADLKRLTDDFRFVLEPVWSPDGEYLAIKSPQNGFYVINVNDSDVRHLLEESTLDGTGPLSWSPDGARLLFSVWEDSRRELFIINRDGSNLERLSHSLKEWEGYESATWSPDGTKIAFIYNTSNENDVYVMNADGTEMRRLTNSSELRLYEYLQWSPNGELLVYQVHNGFENGSEDIYVVDINQGSPTRLTTHEASDKEPAWSPDSKQIVFVSGRDGNLELYLINADGTNLTRLTNNTVNDRSPDWVGN